MKDSEDCIPCPICHGFGQIKQPRKDPNKKEIRLLQQEMAKKLHDKGYSLREIMTYFNYKSPRSAQFLLEQTIKTKGRTDITLEDVTGIHPIDSNKLLTKKVLTKKQMSSLTK